MIFSGSRFPPRIKSGAGLFRDHAAAALQHDPEKWMPVFPKRSCSIKELERDDEST
jgi:hypothetical protein